MGKTAKVTAFELDPAVAGDVDAHPFVFGGFPGRWQVGWPTLPSALGLSVTGMRSLIDRFDLPLVEVQVAESDAHDDFPVDPQKIESGPAGTVKETQAPLMEINGQLVPGPPPAGQHPPLQPHVAAEIAAETARRNPDLSAVEIVDELPVEEGSEAEQAATQAVEDSGEVTD